jgi:hypothetical protein
MECSSETDLLMIASHQDQDPATKFLIVTATVEFLDKCGMQLCNWPTPDSNSAKTKTLLQSLYGLFEIKGLQWDQICINLNPV